MRKLCVSFTSLLYALVAGRVTAEDLGDALFYFGCVREHALRPWEDEINEVEWIARDVGDDRAKEVHGQLVVALEAAQAEGRVRYRHLKDRVSYEQLNELLTANGYPALTRTVEGIPDGGAYSYPGVEHRVQALGIHLEVVR